MPARIEDYLYDSARRLGDRTALVCGDERIGYARLLALSEALANVLLHAGVGPGDRVLILLDNGWRFAAGTFATWIAGAVICPINPSTKAGRLSEIAGDCTPAFILAEARLAGLIDGVTALAGVPRLFAGEAEFEAALAAPPDLLGRSVKKDSLAALIYTSGSTGRPKGVMLGHDNLDAAAGAIVTYLRNTEHDRLLAVLPMSFGYGLSQLLTAVRVGATLVVEKSFAFPQAVFQTIAREKVTGFALVPTMVATMMQARDLDPSLFASLRYLTSAAAPLPLSHLDWLRAFVPEADVYVMYGQSECIRATYLPPGDIDARRGSAGIAIPGTDIAVVDAEGHAVAAGTVGELVIAGPHVMRGYFDDPAATARALRPDPTTGRLRLHTGDLFVSDAEGYVSFVARQDDIIKSRGEKVAPKAVEEALCALPGIAEALVVGVPHETFGEAVKAVIVRADPALTEREVMRHCARLLEDHMLPRVIEFRSELPKTQSGKAIRRLAVEWAAEPFNPQDASP